MIIQSKNIMEVQKKIMRFNGLKISYAIQPIPSGRNKPLGTADALLWGLKSKPEWAGSKFTVCNSDNLYSQKALQLMLSSPYIGALIDYDRSALEFETSRIEKFSVTIKDENGFLKDIIEKPSADIIEKVKNRKWLCWCEYEYLFIKL